jgi:hypothetical protein
VTQVPRIRVYWSKPQKDLAVAWDKEAGGANPRYILGLFPVDVTEELERRGYDITTLRFSIKKKEEHAQPLQIKKAQLP